MYEVAEGVMVTLEQLQAEYDQLTEWHHLITFVGYVKLRKIFRSSNYYL